MPRTIDRRKISFLKISELFKPPRSLHKGKQAGKKLPEIARFDRVNQIPQVTITGNTADIVHRLQVLELVWLIDAILIKSQ